MPRRYRPPRREAAPDAKYNSESVSRFLNRMMWNGKEHGAACVVSRF